METFKEWWNKRKSHETLGFSDQAHYLRDMTRLHKLERQKDPNRLDAMYRKREMDAIRKRWEERGIKVKPHKLGEPRTLLGKIKKKFIG